MMINQFDTQPKNKRLLLSEEITSESVGRIINQIFEINNDDDLKSSVYKDYVRLPIFLFINSCGGSVYDGLSLVDVIKNSETPVVTIALGSCMSMGLWIWLAGFKRFVGANSTLMFHEISSFIDDKLKGLENEVKEMKRLQNLENKLIVETSKVTQEMLDKHIKEKNEWYITPKEAIKLKLADGYYEMGF